MQKRKDIVFGRYIDPLTDFGFKLLFGSEPNKDLLISFLNGLLSGRKIITDLSFGKTEYSGPQSRFRKSVFDLTCTSNNGENFIIEIQRIYQHFFKDRAIYYTSTLIQAQAPKGKPKWDFKLQEVYLIAIMDFNFADSPSENYLHRIHLADEVTGRVFYEKLGYIFVELPKFTKAENQLETDLDRWLYVLKNMSTLKRLPVFLKKRIFEKLFTIAEVSQLTKEDFMQYEKSMMAKWDEYAIVKTAEDQGIEKGREKGREEGREEKSVEVVKNLLSYKKLTISEIANIANVTEAFVLKIKNTN